MPVTALLGRESNFRNLSIQIWPSSIDDIAGGGCVVLLNVTVWIRLKQILGVVSEIFG